MVAFIGHRCNSLAKLNHGVSALKPSAKECVWVEVDVALSRGKLVLFHDMGVQVISTQAISTQTIPTQTKSPMSLQDAFEWLRSKTGVKLILDLKCMGIHQQLYTSTLLEVLDKNKDLKDVLVLTSFHHPLLQTLFAALGCAWTYGAIVEAALINLPAYLKTHLAFCTFVMVSHHIYSQDTMQALRDYRVGVYTVNNPAVWPVLEKIGVEFIFRDV